jgi:hypothetical protein
VYVVSVCREIVDQGELNTYWQRVNETLVSHKARVLYGSPEVSGHECAFHLQPRFASRHHL